MSEPWTEDRPTEHDDAIRAALPTRGGDPRVYERAVVLVGAKHSKYALVDLVNWLLARAEKAEAAEKELQARHMKLGGYVIELEKRVKQLEAAIDPARETCCEHRDDCPYVLVMRRGSFEGMR